MKRGRAVRAAIALVTIGIVAAGASAQPLSAGAPRPSAGRGYVAGSAIATGGPIHGMTLANANHPLDTVLGDLPRLAADGVNLVSIYVTQYIDSATATYIHPGTYTPSDQELETAISLAHQNGMAVELSPIVWTAPYVWRGGYAPDDVDTFFTNYRTMMNHYAELAEANNVEMVAIGSEYSSLERYGAEWTRVANEVRARFSGLTTYQAVTQDFLTISWWAAVDYIGVSPYYPVSYAAHPTYDDALASWTGRWFPDLRRAAAKYNRPVLFNEIGYLSAESAGAEPWESTSKEPASEQAQADLYRALLDAADTQPWLRGIVFFRWSEPVSAPVDTSYSPRDKLAECVIASRWAAPDAPVGVDGRPLMCLGGSATAETGISH